jgi:hypothetical protein
MDFEEFNFRLERLTTEYSYWTDIDGSKHKQLRTNNYKVSLRENLLLLLPFGKKDSFNEFVLKVELLIKFGVDVCSLNPKN